MKDVTDSRFVKERELVTPGAIRTRPQSRTALGSLLKPPVLVRRAPCPFGLYPASWRRRQDFSVGEILT